MLPLGSTLTSTAEPEPPTTLAETTWFLWMASRTTEVSTVFGPPAEETSCMTARTATTARTTQITGPRKCRLTSIDPLRLVLAVHGGGGVVLCCLTTVRGHCVPARRSQ